MGTRIYGIAASENVDNSGETILIDGIDTSRLRGICDEHGSDAWSIIGGIDYHSKIHNEQECKDEQELKCWRQVQVPFLFIRAELADSTGHPNAQAAASLLRFTTAHPDLPLKPGLSIEGGIVQRAGHDQKTLAKTLATMTAYTVKPCNPKCSLYLENDLAKSQVSSTPPAVYLEALKKSQATHSFRELAPKALLAAYLDDLKKSLDDYRTAFTSMKCHRCGQGVRFFKSSKDYPNRCPHCNSAFSVAHLWAALNKKG